ncbi:MAG: flagellar biosynthesis anti-sigma factor FlgM [Desulfobacterales bacterium]
MKINQKQTVGGRITALDRSGHSRQMDPIHKPPLPEEPKGDKVVLSGGVRQAQMAMWRSRSVSASDSEAVESLKKRVQKNAYLFDNRLIARKLMAEHLLNHAV